MRLTRTTLSTIVFVTGSFLLGSAVAEESLKLTKAIAEKKSQSSKKEHPLVRVIEFATDGLEYAHNEIDEYSCLLIKRERVEGRLTPRQYMQAKIRHRRVVDGEIVTPFSVYLKFLKPDALAGREVLYVENQRNGDVLARRGGPRLGNITVELDPHGYWAMQDNLHPITEIGFHNLIQRLIENMRGDLVSDDVEVKYFDNAKLGDRDCEHIQVTHTHQDPLFDYHVARIFIDKEMRVPVYFASYLWPETEGGEPLLKEEYMFANVNLNPGFTDAEFDAANPQYAFEPLSSRETVARSEK